MLSIVALDCSITSLVANLQNVVNLIPQAISGHTETRYTGDWLNDLQSGNGSEEWSDGATYSGHLTGRETLGRGDWNEMNSLSREFPFVQTCQSHWLPVMTVDCSVCVLNVTSAL